MRLFFCDICNESIPLQDIKENKSATIKGKIFCRKCNPLNELSGGDSGRGSGGGAGGSSSTGMLVVVALLLFLVLCGLGYVIYEMKMKPDGAATDTEPTAISTMEKRLAELETAVASLRGDVEALPDLIGLAGQVSRIEDDAADSASSQSRISKEVEELQRGLVAVGSLRERVEALTLRQDEAAQKLALVAEAHSQLQIDFAALRDNPVVASGATDGMPAGTDVEGAADGSELDPELLAIVEKLSDEDPMTRWEAVDQIRRKRDKALIPHVIPVLEDRDTFVRAQAIYTLGELKAMPAVPHLVKLLRDDEMMIREEALASLVHITGQNLKFDVAASRSVREKGVRKWEEWLDKNKDKF